MKPKRFVIIAAGGSGSRTGLGFPKQVFRINGVTLLERAIGLFLGETVFVPLAAELLPEFGEKLGTEVTIVEGGATRFESVRNAFAALPQPADEDLVLIHDAARPFLDPATLPQAWSLAHSEGAVVYASAAVDTIKRADGDGFVAETLDRRTIFLAQTPQIFRAGLLRRAYDWYAGEEGARQLPPTDEASLLEAAGIPVRIYSADPSNRKITHKEDLKVFQNSNLRIGHGYDVHRFDPTRKLYLCGMEIPAGPGLAGHSDADVAIHALIDAMLGAAGLGDIGQWFPDHDPAFRNIRSTVLLERVWRDLSARGYTLVNGDLTIVAQIPRLAPYKAEMVACLEATLRCEPGRINVKATTTEGLGFVGQELGMAANAVVLLAAEASP